MLINRIIKFTLPVAFGLTIICFSVLFTLSFRSLYYFSMDRLSIADNSKLEKEEIKADYETLIEYLTNKEIDNLSFENFTMSEEGRIHFDDVKEIFMLLRYVMYFMGAYTIITSIIKIRNRKYNFLKYTAIGVIIIPIFILLVALINFDKAFVLFHKIAFTNDYWIFDPITDPIITVLPQEFFYYSFLFIVGIILVIAVLLMITYKILNNNGGISCQQ